MANSSLFETAALGNMKSNIPITSIEIIKHLTNKQYMQQYIEHCQ